MRKFLLTTILALPLGAGALWAQDTAEPSAADKAGAAVEQGYEDMGESASKEGEAILDATDDTSDATADTTTDAADDTTGDMTESTDTETMDTETTGTDDLGAATDDTATSSDMMDPAASEVSHDQAADELRAEWLKGAKVTSPAEDSIGDIKDLILDDQGQVKAVVIGVGGFLGIGEKQIAVDWSDLTITEDGKTITSTLTKEDADAAPEYVFRKQDEAAGDDGSMMAPETDGTADPVEPDSTAPDADMSEPGMPESDNDGQSAN